MIELYPHNREAYDKACTMMKRYGKAAIIHPTGTGKSFIAFKLVEEHPSEIICWLPPSDYIFETQVENVRALAGILTQEQISKLDAIGMQWEIRHRSPWDNSVAQAEKYAQDHGDLDVKDKYVSEDGFKLGSWIAVMRKKRDRGELSAEQIAQLDEIGMIWKPYEHGWMEFYGAACEYFRTHGHLLVPSNYVAPHSLRLGAWIKTQRRRYKGTFNGGRPLTPERIVALNRIGMVWDKLSNQWECNYLEAKNYFDEHNHLRIPRNTYTSAGQNLWHWINHQKEYVNSRELPPERIARLKQIGIVRSEDAAKYSVGQRRQSN